MPLPAPYPRAIFFQELAALIQDAETGRHATLNWEIAQASPTPLERYDDPDYTVESPARPCGIHVYYPPHPQHIPFWIHYCGLRIVLMNPGEKAVFYFTGFIEDFAIEQPGPNGFDGDGTVLPLKDGFGGELMGDGSVLPLSHLVPERVKIPEASFPSFDWS